MLGDVAGSELDLTTDRLGQSSGWHIVLLDNSGPVHHKLYTDIDQNRRVSIDFATVVDVYGGSQASVLGAPGRWVASFPSAVPKPTSLSLLGGWLLLALSYRLWRRWNSTIDTSSHLSVAPGKKVCSTAVLMDFDSVTLKDKLQ
jgi:hypothetical protein